MTDWHWHPEPVDADRQRSSGRWIVHVGALLALLALAPAVGRAQPGVPTLTGRVVDRADLLGDATEIALTAQLAAHEDATSNQIAVLTVPSLNGEDLEPWATEVFRTWGLGREDADNGVLLLIARDDRKIRIEVGYGFEGALPDATAGAIIRDEMTPLFRSGDFEGGTLAAVDAILSSISGEYEPRAAPALPLDIRIFLLVFCTIPVLLILTSLRDGVPVAESGGLAVAIAVFSLFIAAPISAATKDWRWLLLLVAIPLALVVLNALLEVLPGVGERRQRRRAYRRRLREAKLKAQAAGESYVVVDGTRHWVPTVSSGGGSNSDSSSSSSSSFSGGGGSSGGGGASGGW